MSQIRAVIFDLGRVLVQVDFSRGLIGRLRRLAEASADPTAEKAVYEEIYAGFGTGQLSPDEFRRAICRRSGLKLSPEEFKHQWCDIFSPMEGMEALLREVSKRLPVGILSDTDPWHWNHELAAHPWLKLVPKPTLSFEIGVLKPAPEAFLSAANNVGVAPQHCLFADDLPKNIMGAKRVGMEAIQFESASQLRHSLIGKNILGE